MEHMTDVSQIDVSDAVDIREIKRTIEAILFAAGHPISYDKLADVLNKTPAQVRKIVREYAEEYKHTVWKKYFPKGGHDGMDELVYRAFFESAKNGTNPPIDVYDAAAWMSITALTEKSIALGGAPVEIPDFTKGKWMNRTDIADGDFSLKI